MATSNPWDALGGSSGEWAQLSTKYGITASDVAALQAQGYTAQTAPDFLKSLQGQVGIGSVQQPASGGQYGKAGSGASSSTGGLSLSDLIQLKSAVGGRGGGQSGQAPSSNVVPVSNDPMNAATNLGAAALGMRAVYNPTPTQAGAKSGVGTVASPTSSDAVPGVPAGPWNTTAGVFGNQQQAAGMQAWSQMGGSGNPADAAAIEKKQGWAPGTVAKQFYDAGVQQGKISAPAAPTSGGTPVPMTPANAAGAVTTTPFATAPAAPGIQPSPFMEAHTSALENAGKAIFSHFGGDPATATPDQIMDFHNQLNGMIGSIAQPASNQGGPTTALATGGNATPGGVSGIPSLAELMKMAPPPSGGGTPPTGTKEPIKMVSGGWVPGDPDAPPDSVNARLTPGEYVIPRAQAKRLSERPGPIAARANAPAAPGGTQAQNQPANQQQGSSSNPYAPSSQSGGIDWNAIAQARAGQTMRQNATLAANTPAYPTATTPAAQGYAAAANAGQIGGSAPSAATVQSAAAMTPAQTQGSIAQANMGAAGTASVISGLASGLTKAAQTYADSFKAWTPQDKAFGNAPPPSYQPVTLREQQA